MQLLLAFTSIFLTAGVVALATYYFLVGGYSPEHLSFYVACAVACVFSTLLTINSTR